MNIKSIYKVALLLLLIVLCVACTSNSQSQLRREFSPADSRIKVLCTTGMVRDLVSCVGQHHVDTLTLIKEDLDPHTYELIKGDDEKFLSADLVFYNGLGLEHSPNIYRHLKEHAHSFSIGDFIREKHSDEIISVDGQLDPHIWMDISLWKHGIDLIVQELSNQDPEHRDFYQEQGLKLHEEMKQTHDKIYALLQEIPEKQRYLVTCHDAFNYFTRSYLATPDELKKESWKERCKSPEGLSPDSQLSMSDIQDVVTHLQKHNIEVIFPESNVNLDSVKKIREVTNKLGRRLFIAPFHLYADSMGKKGEGQDTYLKMLYYNAEVIAKCLKSKEAYDQK